MADRYDALKLDSQLCFPLYACAKEVVRRYTPFLDEIGLTYTQYIVMLVLWERERLTVKALGETLFLDSGTLTPVLKKLEQKGLVTRGRCPEDERCVEIACSPEGFRLRERAAEIPFRMAACLPIAQEDAAQLYVLLRRALSSMRASAQES